MNEGLGFLNLAEELDVLKRSILAMLFMITGLQRH